MRTAFYIISTILFIFLFIKGQKDVAYYCGIITLIYGQWANGESARSKPKINLEDFRARPIKKSDADLKV